MTMTATATPTDGGLRHRVEVNGRHTIFTDEPARLGGSDTAPTPHELLPATIAACVSTMIALYAHNRGWELPGLRVEVSYDPDQTPRPATVTVYLPSGLAPDQVARLRRVAETCPVKRALDAAFAFDLQLILGGEPAARAA